MTIIGNKLSEEMCVITGVDDVTDILSDDVNVMRRNKDCADFVTLLIGKYAPQSNKSGLYDFGNGDGIIEARVAQVLKTVRAGSE